MTNIEEIVSSLNKNEKVSIVYGENSEMFSGYVEHVSQTYLTIHEYVPDIYRTFQVENIIEIERE